MERKIGEVFKFEGKKLKVVQATRNLCHDCYFWDNVNCQKTSRDCGECNEVKRTDHKSVTFKEVEDEPEEQPQEQTEQQEETEELIERKVGEVFEYEGEKLKVVTNDSTCDGCYFQGKLCENRNRNITGICGWTRKDDKYVKFVKVTEEQRTEQQPQKLDLCEILKHCPVGELFWSPMLGDVKYYGIDQINKEVGVTVANGITWDINADGTLTVDDVTSEEIMLYPSREQRDWTKVKYEPKKELPRTWEEFCEQNPIRQEECFIAESSKIKGTGLTGFKRGEKNDRNLLPSKQAAEAHLAHKQLHQLRDAWREGWVPDWTNELQSKYIIYNYKGELTTMCYSKASRFLSFQDEKRANEFMDCFIDLIRKAGDLI